MLGKKRMLVDSSFRLLVSVGFLLFPVVISQIPLGSKLSVVESNYWTSSNGKFAIGFLNRSGRYSVGIRFSSNSIPAGQQMVVWVAGGDLTVGDESYFQLTQYGDLVLYDSVKGANAWTSNSTKLSVASAVLLDSGNFVLLNIKREIVWQSFDTPTDTLLPGQNLSGFQMLRASSRNAVSSYYSLQIGNSGQLQLRWESNFTYWTSGNSSHSILRAVLSSDGTLQLLDQRSEVIWSVSGEDHNDSDVKLRFLRLDVDGNLRLYSWVDESRSWRPVWLAVENQCDVFATCDLHGICMFNASGFPVCKCPFRPANESNSKCVLPYKQDCQSGSFMTIHEHTIMSGLYPPDGRIIQSSLQKCKRLCLEDPLCTAVTFMNDGTTECRITRTRYVTGQSNPFLSSISFVRSCSDPVAALPLPPTSSASFQDDSKRANRVCIACLVGIASGTFVVLFLIQVGFGFYIYKRRKFSRRKGVLAYTGPNATDLITLSFSEIKDITGNFQNQIGPKMFKGMLPNSRSVAVKDMKTAIEGRKFRSAVLKIGSIYHKNLVQLEGYCCETDHRFLVYEYAMNGSLARCIEDPKLCKRLTWGRRMQICLAVARGICYLHTECREFFSHGNLKSQNVVLDENFDAKVSEFGLGKLHGEASNSCGTAEADISDFGKVVLSLVTGRPEADDVGVWAYEKWVQGQAEELVDRRIDNGVDSEELERALRIAFWCLQVDEQMRPSMGEVVKVLEGLAVDPPPPPFVCRRAELEANESSTSEIELQIPNNI
ncbi:G-type lectin S-receptor-like serine/threonine-protein kinase SD3-1 isoform X2 [Diospyros lotus]|nr:G-type lectin S-receptor-like serine/threonine-protein kinase SD3-1 isoform X2 [Diospyros lotus]